VTEFRVIPTGHPRPLHPIPYRDTWTLSERDPDPTIEDVPDEPGEEAPEPKDEPTDG
jgi:hypothetical protein